MLRYLQIVAFLLLSLVGASGAIAAPIVQAPLPSNAFITHNGYEWAWAYPLPAPDSGFDLSYQSQFGWRIPTLAELLLAPQATDFLFDGANVPLGGLDPVSGAFFGAINGNLNEDGAVAVPYFSNSYHHADWQDGNGQPFQPWAGLPGARSFADQLVIREIAAAEVPEPASLAVWSLVSMAGIAAWRRRKSTSLG